MTWLQWMVYTSIKRNFGSGNTLVPSINKSIDNSVYLQWRIHNMECGNTIWRQNSQCNICILQKAHCVISEELNISNRLCSMRTVNWMSTRVIWRRCMMWSKYKWEKMRVINNMSHSNDLWKRFYKKKAQPELMTVLLGQATACLCQACSEIEG